MKINKQFLNHDTHTDIISFDYSKKSVLEAEFFISMWAVRLSAKEESQSIVNETLRVISHGVLHCFGLKDKNDTEKSKMRIKEKEFIDLFHVKHKSNV